MDWQMTLKTNGLPKLTNAKIEFYMPKARDIPHLISIKKMFENKILEIKFRMPTINAFAERGKLNNLWNGGGLIGFEFTLDCWASMNGIFTKDPNKFIEDVARVANDLYSIVRGYENKVCGGFKEWEIILGVSHEGSEEKKCVFAKRWK